MAKKEEILERVRDRNVTKGRGKGRGKDKHKGNPRSSVQSHVEGMKGPGHMPLRSHCQEP